MSLKQTVSVRNLVFASLCVAIGVVLPITLHQIPNAGSVLLPMHLPVLLCGLACGWAYGLGCGLLTPLLSSLITGMPPAAYLPSMLFELAAYGLIAGLLYKIPFTRARFANLYISLGLAMLAGRAVYGLANALIFRAGSYSMQIFLSGAFVTALPGIAIQLALLPVLVKSLEKAGVLK